MPPGATHLRLHLAVTFSGYMIFAFIYLSQQWDTVLPMTHVYTFYFCVFWAAYTSVTVTAVQVKVRPAIYLSRRSVMPVVAG